MDNIKLRTGIMNKETRKIINDLFHEMKVTSIGYRKIHPITPNYEINKDKTVIKVATTNDLTILFDSKTNRFQLRVCKPNVIVDDEFINWQTYFFQIKNRYNKRLSEVK